MKDYLGYSRYSAFLGSRFGSKALASILYQTSLGDFVYSTDGSGNAILDNQGSLGSANDGLPYSGRAIELGALNDTTIGDAAKWTTWFSFSDNKHHKVFGVKVFVSETINSILVSASEPSTATIADFDANPNLVGKLALSGTGTISEVDLVLVASDSYYMCSENSGAYLVDSRASYSVHTDNADFINSNNWTVSTGITFLDSNIVFDGTTPAWDGATADIVTGINNGDVVYLVVKDLVLTANAPYIRFGGDEFYIFGDGVIQITVTDNTKPLDILSPASAFTGSIGYAGIHKATAQEIANYPTDDSVRLNADQQQVGPQTRPFSLDGAGVPTSYTPEILNYYSKDTDNTQWNPSLESAFWLEEVIDGVVYQHKYDGTNLTTYTDNVAGTPALHSPENASYLLGKGVYPKVTADPYTSYQSKTFQLHIGSLYTSYDQTARYAILAAM